MMTGIRKAVALLLSVCVCMSMLITVPFKVSAADDLTLNVVTIPDMEISTLNEKANGAHILKYTDFNEKDVASIEVLTYNDDHILSRYLKFQYDTQLLTMCKSDGTTFTNDKFKARLQTALSSKRDPSVLKDPNMQELTWLQSDADGDYPAPFELGTGTSATADGEVFVEFEALNAVDMMALKDQYVDGFIDGAETTMGQAGPISLYTIYFKKTGAGKDGSGVVTPETFEVTYSTKLNKNAIDQNMTAALVNFPKAAAPKYDGTITVQTGSGTGVPGAAVNVYKDAGLTNLVEGNVKTDGTGVATLGQNYEEGTKYYFTVSQSGYQTLSDSFTMGNSKLTKTVTLTAESEVKYDVTLTVKDRDSGKALSGAVVTVDATETGTSGAEGTVTLKLTPGNHNVTSITNSGYEAMENQGITVTAKDGAASAEPSEFQVVAKRAQVELPVPRDPKGGVVDGATITLTVTGENAEERKNWGENGKKVYTVQPRTATVMNEGQSASDVILTSGEESIEGNVVGIPANTDYEIEMAAAGYLAPGAVYLTVGSAEAPNASYYANPDKTGVYASLTEVPQTLTKLSAPAYEVQVKKGSEGVYTAEVTLENINASYGTFGLEYDGEVFELDTTGGTEETNNGFKLNETELSLFDPQTGSDKYPAVVSDEEIGYHVFAWQAKAADAEGSGSFDTTSGAKKVATYTFRMKDGKSEKDITTSSFMVMEYDKTSKAIEYVKNVYGGKYTEGYERFLNGHFRYTDELNELVKARKAAEEAGEAVPDLPEGVTEEDLEGRLSPDMAKGYVSTPAKTGLLETKGYYQVFAIGTELDTGDKLYDTVTRIVTDFEAEKTGLVFTVVDENNAPLPGTELRLYEPGSIEAGMLKPEEKEKLQRKANAAGKVKLSFEGGATYGYNAEKLGYWDNPRESERVEESLKGKDVKTLTVAEKATKQEEVVMETKVYHNVYLKEEAGGKVEGDFPAEEGYLASGRFAYNGQDYIVKIKGVEGKAFTAPETVWYMVDRDAETSRPSSAVDGKLTSDPEWEALMYDANVDGYIIPKTALTGEMNSDAAAGMYGFESTNVYVRLGRSMVTDTDAVTYTVTGQAGANGTVSYTAAEPAGSETADGDESKRTVSGIVPGSSIGSLSFKAKEGYKVEKVYVNGVRVVEYENMTEFTYSDLKKIHADESIMVTFWDGKTASGESVVTLIVGERGKVSTTAPESASDVTDERKSWLVSNGGNLNFTAVADEGYQVLEVEKQTAPGNREKVTGTEGAYIVEVGKNEDLSVTVTFSKDGTTPLNVYVTSYVHEGLGSIQVSGVTKYEIGEAPEYELAGREKYRPEKVIVDGRAKKLVESKTEGNPAEYTYLVVPQLKGNQVIGAVFAEEGYPVQGLVDWSQGTNLYDEVLNASAKTGGIATFTRRSDKKEKKVQISGDRKNASFQVELPEGTWDLEISKRGYVNIRIKGFEVDAEDGIETYYFGAAEGAETPKKITPLIGNTNGKGLSVSLADVGVVANGLRASSTVNQKAKADVDDDGSVGVMTDMAFVKLNYGARDMELNYADFKDTLSPSPDPSPGV